jgi:hypothetical protein
MIEQANGINAYQKLLKTDPELAERALHKQWSNLLAIIGYQVMPDLIKGTMWLIDRLKTLSEWVKNNEGKTRLLVTAFAGLSSALLLGGAVTVLSGAFRGLGLALALEKAGGLAGIASLGTRLTGAATGLGALTKAAGIFMAAYAGWKIGGFLNEHVINPLARKLPGADENDTLGTWFYEITHRNQGIVSQPIHRKESSAPVIHNHIYVDSKEVASVMFPKKSLGPTNINPLSWQVTPSMNVGMP